VGGGPGEFFDGSELTFGPYPPYDYDLLTLQFYLCVFCDSVFFLCKL